MITRRDIPPLHEIARVEQMIRFMMFLRKIGIKAAGEESEDLWKWYMTVMSELTVGG